MASLLGFIVMHGNLVLANMTTIEMYEKKKTLPWKYDKGRWENFKEIFGDNVFSWLLPFHTKRSERENRPNGWFDRRAHRVERGVLSPDSSLKYAIHFLAAFVDTQI